LLALVWDYEHYDPNVVEVHISALRRKLEAHGPRVIQTVRGVGYVLRS
jgi:DNA-binding response OmpR family regulator